ncbi:MAG: hypothetical protein R3B40_18395 [Polyangiales bacterium]|nr:hypothetical protein [Myxococcales bacterium]MCB9658486.1 hypothetical protein [Sandaracinaceae bacterium]
MNRIPPACFFIATLYAASASAQFSVVTSTTSSYCYGVNNGSATAIPVGGVAPYMYLWSNGAVGATAVNLEAGTYRVFVTDNDGRLVEASVVVTEEFVVHANATITGESCFGASDGSIALEPTNGTAPYTYTWSNGDTRQTNTGLQGGVYGYWLTDANGCTTEESVLLTLPGPTEPLSASITVDADESCAGGADGALTAVGAGGTADYTFTWSDGPATTASRTGLGPDEYMATVTDANGCTAMGSASVAAGSGACVVDAGVPEDAGTMSDAGAENDAAVDATDAGQAEDADTSDDSGTVGGDASTRDAGATVDMGAPRGSGGGCSTQADVSLGWSSGAFILALAGVATRRRRRRTPR